MRRTADRKEPILTRRVSEGQSLAYASGWDPRVWLSPKDNGNLIIPSGELKHGSNQSPDFKGTSTALDSDNIEPIFLVSHHCFQRLFFWIADSEDLVFAIHLCELEQDLADRWWACGRNRGWNHFAILSTKRIVFGD